MSISLSGQLLSLAAGLLLGRELLVSLPFAAAAHPLFRWAQRRTVSE